MSFLRIFVAMVLAALIAAAWATYASAQQPGPHHATHGIHTTMPASMMSSQRMIHDAGTMMASAATMMRDLPVIHVGPHATPHHETIGSMQSMLDHMRQLHGNLNHMSHDPALVHDRDAMKNFQQACQDLKQMATAFESMTKNVTKAMKVLPDARKK